MVSPATNTIKVNLGKRSYDIFIGSDILRLLPNLISKLKLGNAAYIITNAYIKNKFGSQLLGILKKAGFAARFKLVPDSEKSKSMEMASLVIKDLTEYDKKRKVFIIAFGGGVIGDLSGFIASIYKRGIPYIQVPTTLLAQVDSSIGGKTAVDLIQGKNLVGAFYQPRLVLSDINILKTLSLSQIKNGLAEVIKYALIKSPDFFAYLEKNYKEALALKSNHLKFIVAYCAGIKARIVARDEREEKGIRTLLNFGHTLGHAIEAQGDFKRYSHGEAIALGMLLACDISKSLRMMNVAAHQRIEGLIKKVGLPTKIKGLNERRIIEAYYHDKKFSGKKSKFILLSAAGKTKIIENMPLKIIKEALKGRII